MDYKGQELSGQLLQYIILLAMLAGLVYGYITQDFSNTLYSIVLGTIIAFFITVPDWPFYNRNKLTWLSKVDPKDAQRKVFKPSPETALGSTTTTTTTATTTGTTNKSKSRFL
eukprot:GEZU01020567.1.p1 GENE.GEZU01020567.1~~GEZU01020567.1.p1  ORF type:complete len:113 (-),score=28.71 GEZU01020567.1:188-526(-)